MEAARRYRLDHSRRLHGRRAFSAVHEARTRQQAGPLSVATLPNRGDRWRLGLSVPRSVGGAVVRSGVKRMLREAFRLSQHDLPGSYDVVIHVRAHPPATLEEYRSWLMSAARSLDERWKKRDRRSGTNGRTPASGTGGSSSAASTPRRPG